MSTRLSLAAGALLASLALAQDATSQLQAYAGNDERKISQVFLYTGNFDVKGLLSVHYSPPKWKDSYTEMIGGAKPGTRARLGKNMWTTLDTTASIKVGDQTLPQGRYYLAVEMGAEGVVHLVFLDPKDVTKQGVNPMTTSASKGGVSIPMELKKDMDTQADMSMELKPSDDPSHLSLVLRWGPIQATAQIMAMVKA